MNCCLKNIFFFVILFLFFDPVLAANLHRNIENASNDSSLILGERNPLFSDELFADGKAGGTTEGNDLILHGNGEINITLTHGELQFEVCKDCDGTSSVCFDTAENIIKSEVICFGFPSYCNFQVKNDGDKIYFGIMPVYKDDFDGSCARPIMHSGRVSAIGPYLFQSCKPRTRPSLAKKCTIKIRNMQVYKSCRLKMHSFRSCSFKNHCKRLARLLHPCYKAAARKILPYFHRALLPCKFCKQTSGIVNKMIKLYINIGRLCSIKVLNAKVYAPEIPSTPLPSTSKPNDQSTDPSWTASFPWWLILIIAIVVIAVILGIAGFSYYLYKKRQSSNIPPPTEVVPKLAVPNASVATTLETPSKRKHDLNFTQFESSKKSKKSQKKKDKKKKKQQTTQEPTTTNDDAPAPHVTVPPAPIQSNPASSVPYPKRIYARSLKSVKTDSLDETTKIDKLAMVESAPVSFHHHCVKPADADLLEEMNDNYPGNTHAVAKSEVDLLCSPVSKMFSSINELAQEYQQKLAAVGCEFNQNGCITSMSDGARRYIHDRSTPASIVYFAFGAEYYEYLTDDPELLPKFSIPLLLVIAFQPRFSTLNRRKACSLLRRKLPIILGNFTAVQRQTLSFPINAIEEAYCRDPKYFNNVAGIQTDSEGERRRKNENAAGEKRERKSGDGKRKKKSSKKRH